MRSGSNSQPSGSGRVHLLQGGWGRSCLGRTKRLLILLICFFFSVYGKNSSFYVFLLIEKCWIFLLILSFSILSHFCMPFFFFVFEVSNLDAHVSIPRVYRGSQRFWNWPCILKQIFPGLDFLERKVFFFLTSKTSTVLFVTVFKIHLLYFVFHIKNVWNVLNFSQKHREVLGNLLCILSKKAWAKEGLKLEKRFEFMKVIYLVHVQKGPMCYI